jgi:DNA-binding CsgD family transcriptional regulator
MVSFSQLNDCWYSNAYDKRTHENRPHRLTAPGIGSSFDYVFDHHALRFQRVDPAIYDVLGYPATLMQQEGLAFFDRIVRKEEHASTLEMLREGWRFISLQPGIYRRFYALSVDFHAFHRQRHLLHLLLCINILETDSAGNIGFSAGSCYDITYWHKLSASTLHLYYNKKLIRRWQSEQPPQKSISKRELEVVRLICQGHSSSQAADCLNISTNTVNTHRKAIMKKLGVKGLPALIRYAQQHALI